MQFTKEMSSWYLDNGYCDKTQKWLFKVFHKDKRKLYQICNSLVHNGFIFTSVRWNRSLDYDVDGWVATLYIVKLLSDSELYDFTTKLDFWLLENDKYEYATYIPNASSVSDDQSQSVFIGKAAEIIELEPCNLPRNDKSNINWKKVWNRSIDREKKKIYSSLSEIPTPELDEIFNNGVEIDLDVKFLPFSLKGRSVFFTDMRPGPSDDGVKIKLNPGEYNVSVNLLGEKKTPLISMLSLLKDSRSHDKRVYLQDISIDGATVGLYDYQRLRACFGYNSEEMYSWGENLASRSEFPYGVLIYDLKRGYILPYVQTGKGDGVYPVYELFDKGEKVGVQIQFI